MLLDKKPQYRLAGEYLVWVGLYSSRRIRFGAPLGSVAYTAPNSCGICCLNICLVHYICSLLQREDVATVIHTLVTSRLTDALCVTTLEACRLLLP